LAGEWFSGFDQECRKPTFNLAKYIETLTAPSRDPTLLVESTRAGDQHVIPGAERMPTELARRRAAEPLRPKARQRPVDHGLFSDDSKQTDLVDRANARDT
jgi:hypothetical protein